MVISSGGKWLEATVDPVARSRSAPFTEELPISKPRENIHCHPFREEAVEPGKQPIINDE
jgi:hypothetical protein